jgi:hypothetical protein
MQNVKRVESTKKHLTNAEKERREEGEKAFVREGEVLCSCRNI